MANQSDVAAMVAQIEAEYAAANAALHGLASGTARHEVISAKMERAQDASVALIKAIGEEEALPLIVAAMDSGKPASR